MNDNTFTIDALGNIKLQVMDVGDDDTNVSANAALDSADAILEVLGDELWKEGGQLAANSQVASRIISGVRVLVNIGREAHSRNFEALRDATRGAK